MALAPPPPVERVPRALSGTYCLAPTGVTVRGLTATTPLVFLDLTASGNQLTCAPWRPDSQDFRCETAAVSGDGLLNIDLVRDISTRDLELRERWMLRARLVELELTERWLEGSLTIQELDPAGVEGRSRTYKVRAERVIVDPEELIAEWAEEETQRQQRELRREPPPEMPEGNGALTVRPLNEAANGDSPPDPKSDPKSRR